MTPGVRRSGARAGAGLKRIDLYLSPSAAGRARLDGCQLVIVDVLRSCTTIAVALMNRAAKVIPVETVEEATRLAQTLDAKARLLCGEREGRKVGGFDLGNSPRDYVRAKVEGATLIFASTNASPLMAGLLDGREQRLLSYVNMGAVVDAVRKVGSDLAIVCAGKNGMPALEDTACAGAMIGRLTESAVGIELNDAAEIAREYDCAHGREPEAILRRSEHGRELIELGFEEDLPVCADIDSVPVVPFLKEGRITAPSASRAAAG